MLRNIILIFIVFCSISCGKKVCKEPITEIELINKAEYYYGGLKELKITDNQKISQIESALQQLETDLKNSISINENFGYIEVIMSSSACENLKSFNIIFTESYGNIILYNKDNDNRSEYYSNHEIVNFIMSQLNMSENKKKD